MRIKVAAAWITVVGCVGGAPAGAQDLGPQFMKFGDGIYAYVGKNFKSNTGIILTQDGVVLIDSGHEPTDSRAVMEAVKKLTPMPVRFLIDIPIIRPVISSSHRPRPSSPRPAPVSRCETANARRRIGLKSSRPRRPK